MIGSAALVSAYLQYAVTVC